VFFGFFYVNFKFIFSSVLNLKEEIGGQEIILWK